MAIVLGTPTAPTSRRQVTRETVCRPHWVSFVNNDAILGE